MINMFRNIFLVFGPARSDLRAVLCWIFIYHITVMIIRYNVLGTRSSQHTVIVVVRLLPRPRSMCVSAWCPNVWKLSVSGFGLGGWHIIVRPPVMGTVGKLFWKTKKNNKIRRHWHRYCTQSFWRDEIADEYRRALYISLIILSCPYRYVGTRIYLCLYR